MTTDAISTCGRGVGLSAFRLARLRIGRATVQHLKSGAAQNAGGESAILGRNRKSSVVKRPAHNPDIGRRTPE